MQEAQKHRKSATLASVCLLLAWCSLSGVASAQVANQQQLLYLPALQGTDDADLGLALSNPTLSDVTVTLTARAYDGTLINGSQITNPATLTVPASGQLARRSVEIFGAGIGPKTGWVQIASSTPAIRGFFLLFNSALTYIDGAGLQTVPSKRIVFAKVSGSPLWPTTLAFANTSGDSLRFAGVMLYENTGRLYDSKYVPLNAYSGFRGTVLDLFPGATGFQGYAVVESSLTPFSGGVSALVGLEIYGNRSDVAILNGVPETAALRQGFLPHMVSQGGYVTTLGLVNKTGQSQTVRIIADGLVDAGGVSLPAVTVSRTIPGLARIEETANQLFGFTGTAAITGYARWEVQQDGAGLIGYLDYGTPDGTLLAAVPAQGAGFSDLFFSQIAQGSGYYTGLAFLNPGTQASSMQLEAFDANGKRLTSNALTLAPGERLSRLVSELMPVIQNQLGGYIRVSASRPIFAFELFGSSASLSFLANVAAQGVQLQPQLSGQTVSANAGANVITAGSGASIAIPPGSLSTDMSIELQVISSSSLPAPSSQNVVAAAIQAEPSGTKFNIPATLRFPLEVAMKPGTQIPMFIYNPSTRRYEATEFVATVDESGVNATVAVTHFTTFVIQVGKDEFFQIQLVQNSAQPGGSVTIQTGFSTPRTDIAADQIQVFFSGEGGPVAAEVTAVSVADQTVTVKVPVGAITGGVYARLGTRRSNAQMFFVLANNPRPQISSITPDKSILGAVRGLENADIRGMGFANGLRVEMDGTPLTQFIVYDVTHVYLAIPENRLTLGVHKIVVINAAPGGGPSNAVEYTVGYPPPTLEGFNPFLWTADRPTDVTVNGRSFVAQSVVLLDGNPVPTTFVDSTSLLAKINASAGPHTIAVETPGPGGGRTFAASVMVVAPPPPPPPSLTLTSVSPSSGNAGTSVNVTLTGTGFVAGATSVGVSGSGVTVSSVSVSNSTTLTATFVIAPTAPVGSRSVTVFTGTSTSGAVSFSVTANSALPTLTSIGPIYGIRGTTASVTLTGTNFAATGTTVAVSGNGVSVGSINVTSPTSLTAKFAIDAAAALGTRDVTVSANGNTSGAIVFRVDPPPPTFTNITPVSGTRGTSVAVQLTGTNFIAGSTTVTPAKSGLTVGPVTVVNSTTLTTTFTIDPAADPSDFLIVVGTPGGSSYARIFTVLLPVPVLTSITPNVGDLGASVAVTLSGSDFGAPGASIRIDDVLGGSNGISVSFGAVQSSSMSATFNIDGGAAAGPHNVTVVTNSGVSNALQFTVRAVSPTLTSVNPTSGVQGATVRLTVNGTGFVPGYTNVGSLSRTSWASLSSSPGVVNSVSVTNPTSLSALTVLVGPAQQQRSVKVFTPGGSTTTASFTVNTNSLGFISTFKWSKFAQLTQNDFVRGLWGDDKSLYTVLLAPSAFSGIRVLKIDLATSAVTIVATIDPASQPLLDPSGLWSDGTYLYVADRGRHSIVRITIASGEVIRFAGQGFAGYKDSSAGQALFRQPEGVWGDGQFVYVADLGNHVIRKVSLFDGETTTLAGVQSSAGGFSDGRFDTAQFRNPQGLWGDGSYLYVADSANHVIRRVHLVGLGYADDVVTIAGTAGASGLVDGDAASAKFNSPSALWSDGSDLYIAEALNSAIRRMPIAMINASGSRVFAVSPKVTTVAMQTFLGDASVLVPTGPRSIWSDGSTIYIGDGNGVWKMTAAAPALTGINPASVFTGSKIDVLLTGTNFTPGATVSVDGTGMQVISVSVKSGTAIVATFDVDAGALQGAHNVTVTTTGGTSSSQPFMVGTSATLTVNFSAMTIPFAARPAAGTSPTDVWAIGPGTISSGGVPQNFLHWDGMSWTNPTPGELNYHFLGAWALSPTDVWAVGASGSIAHWNGTSWSPFASPAGNVWLNGVWGAASNDVWAVGYSGVVLHWDGTAWMRVSPASISATKNLRGIWGRAANDVWAVGGEDNLSVGASVWHWDGAAWTAVMLPDTLTGTNKTSLQNVSLYSVWGSSSNDVWAVGRLLEFGIDYAYVLHWNGTAWTSTTLKALPSSVLQNVSGSGPNDVWATGRYFAARQLFHWNGAAWTEVALPAGAAVDDGVWSASASEVWVGGTLNGSPAMLRGNPK